MWRFRHLSSAGSHSVTTDHARLMTVNINTGAGASSVAIYNGTEVAANLVALLDSSTKGSHGYGVICDKGILVAITGTPDVTIGYR